MRRSDWLSFLVVMALCVPVGYLLRPSPPAAHDAAIHELEWAGPPWYEQDLCFTEKELVSTTTADIETRPGQLFFSPINGPMPVYRCIKVDQAWQLAMRHGEPR